MALRGNIGDLGIADIFQLIGSQNKTGSLSANHRDEKVLLYFNAGQLVRSQTSRRQRQDLLGAMLCRAEIITPKQLEAALVVQQEKRRRLGDALVELRCLTATDLDAFTRLQSRETVYRLFLWQAGTYEFSPLSQPPEAGHPPIRAEALLMDGLRQADEWAQLRTALNSYATTFEIRTSLDELLATAQLQDTAAEPDLNAAFGDLVAANPFDADVPVGDARLQHIQANERLVYSLVRPGRDVQKLIDLSRLGEFDACRALVNLVDAEFLTAAAHRSADSGHAASVGGIQPDGPLRSLLTPVLRALRLAVAVVVWALLCASGLSPWGASMATGVAAAQPAALDEAVAQGRLRLLGQALGTFRAQHGAPPASLRELVTAGLVEAQDLSFPAGRPYAYDGDETGVTLARPLQLY